MIQQPTTGDRAYVISSTPTPHPIFLYSSLKMFRYSSACLMFHLFYTSIKILKETMKTLREQFILMMVGGVFFYYQWIYS